jgi:hypothetical protein
MSQGNPPAPPSLSDMVRMLTDLKSSVNNHISGSPSPPPLRQSLQHLIRTCLAADISVDELQDIFDLTVIEFTQSE